METQKSKGRRIVMLLIIVAVVLLVLWALENIFVSSLSLRSKNLPSAPLGAGNTSRSYLGYEDQGNTSAADTANSGDLTERKIVKNGSLSLIVEDTEETVASIQRLADDAGGFVQQSRVYEVKEGIKKGQISIRVPAEKFAEVTTDIKNLAVEVQNDQTNTNDVTEQYIDLEAQLKNLEAQESQYLKILDRSYTVEDTLKVTQHLNTVRSQIERITGQIKYLNNQIDMSAISVDLTAEEDVEVFGLRWKPLSTVKQSARTLLDGLVSYTNAVIRFALILPLILLWLFTITILGWIGWKLFRWGKRKFFSPAKEQL